MKKIFLILYLFFAATACFAVKQSLAIVINQLPQQGIALKSGWKFHAGDSSKWAAPMYNDNGWQDIKPATPIDDLSNVRQAKIGWFRLKFEVGKTLQGKTVAFSINQIGASQIYLNGVLIREYGRVSGNENEEQVYDPRGQPLTVQLSNNPGQVLAIRYSYTHKNVYIGTGQNAFEILLSWPSIAWGNFADYFDFYTHRSFMFGVFILLGIVHLLVYLNYPSGKINLYLSMYALFQSCVFSNAMLGTLFSANSKVVFDSIFYISAPIASGFLLLTVYDICKRPRRFLFWLLILFLAVTIPVQFWRNYGPREIMLNLSGVLVHIEIIRVSVIALKRKQPGAVLFLFGQSIALIFFCSFSYIDYFYQQPVIYSLVEVDLAFLTPAIVISLLLAHEFALSHISLKQQLVAVKNLSEKNRAQELEKLQILATQNESLEKQVELRTNELSHSLTHLKQTQSQLIQSEKMASLGELTAGIAHEIQNPLNFVNNFSEVSIELLEELTDEAKAGHNDEVIAIAGDLSQNLEKINQHGKRADFIVKGMLQHSRTSTGERQLTNINVLANEFFKLSYQGLRAKDKLFNAGMVTNFDPHLPAINIVQQDIGRVLLNLFNNAFYAVDQKQKAAGTDFKPEVSVSTSTENGQLVIRVKDNGIGIPDAIKDKIMQPFFTTKPAGEGTGLGLSLTYDMVVKGHGGSLQVNSTEGEGSEFIIQLPV